jgi:hypothetical protein
MKSEDTRSHPVLRYGDFPELFWDARPDVLIDVRNPVTLARILTRARAETVGQLVPLEVLREHLMTLTLPEHVLVFWQAVLTVCTSSGADQQVEASLSSSSRIKL